MADTALEKTGVQAIGTMLEQKKVAIKDLLPTDMNVEKYIKSALLAVTRSDYLKKCTPQSVVTAVVNAAETGLSFTPILGHAYLVPYKDLATFMPGYRGMIHLACKTGMAKRIEARIVRDGDTFEVQYGTSASIKHIPKFGGNVTGVYAIAYFDDGTYQFEYMTYAEVEAIRKRSKAANNGPWVSDPEEMMRKTVVRRLFKYLPARDDERLSRAIEYDNEAFGLDVTQPDDGRTRTDKLADIIGVSGSTDAEVIPDDGIAFPDSM